eukprot:TRINITY_DN8415_c0_g1::TRINITY_DN8415_c0_g1_i1::g.3491::m.3491 TRINITY_DN8415_c0_g1::TRINITY_DN8415_c0_g1_i1::g.3491  ORF type:complete len:627 (+),score=75.20,Ric8/PF10165.4/9.1,Ric8/PF10165.4/0.00057 TRINITY_DN8415_c0_g1_i1:270-1883(+)
MTGCDALWESESIQLLANIIHTNTEFQGVEEDHALVILVNVTVLDTKFRSSQAPALETSGVLSTLITDLSPAPMQPALESWRRNRLLHRWLCISRILVHLGARAHLREALVNHTYNCVPALHQVIVTCLDLITPAPTTSSATESPSSSGASRSRSKSGPLAALRRLSLFGSSNSGNGANTGNGGNGNGANAGNGGNVTVTTNLAGCMEILVVEEGLKAFYSLLSGNVKLYHDVAIYLEILDTCWLIISDNNGQLSGQSLPPATKSHAMNLLLLAPEGLRALWFEPQLAISRAEESIKSIKNKPIPEHKPTDTASSADSKIQALSDAPDDNLNKDGEGNGGEDITVPEDPYAGFEDIMAAKDVVLQRQPMGGIALAHILKGLLEMLQWGLSDAKSDVGFLMQRPTTSLVPVLCAMIQVVKLVPLAQYTLFAAIFGADTAQQEFPDVKAGVSLPEDTPTGLKDELISWLTAGSPSAAQYAGELIHELCARHTDRMVRVATLERAMGFLVNRGLFSMPPQAVNLSDLRAIRDELREHENN